MKIYRCKSKKMKNLDSKEWMKFEIVLKEEKMKKEMAFSLKIFKISKAVIKKITSL